MSPDLGVKFSGRRLARHQALVYFPVSFLASSVTTGSPTGLTPTQFLLSGIWVGRNGWAGAPENRGAPLSSGASASEVGSTSRWGSDSLLAPEALSPEGVSPSCWRRPGQWGPVASDQPRSPPLPVASLKWGGAGPASLCSLRAPGRPRVPAVSCPLVPRGS